MSNKLPAMSSTKFVRLLQQAGVVFVRQRGTSHAIFERVRGVQKYRAPVVVDKEELAPKYIKMVLKQLGFTEDEISGLFP